jgi:hypothetical protein
MLETLPLLPYQEYILVGPRFEDGLFTRPKTVWKRCVMCGHHSHLAGNVCQVCDW